MFSLPSSSSFDELSSLIQHSSPPKKRKKRGEKQAVKLDLDTHTAAVSDGKSSTPTTDSNESRVLISDGFDALWCQLF
eukprot:scaffold1662_cov121-Skeletonema_marinoi.AAC.10